MRVQKPKHFMCVECMQEKPPEAFHWKRHASGPSRKRRCIACMRASISSPEERAEFKRQYYAARRAKGRALIRSMKRRPCADCAISYPVVCMDFDHVRGTKRFSIAPATSRPCEEIRAEIAKCDVVCSNCHRVRTALRRLGLPLLQPRFQPERDAHDEAEEYLDEEDLYEALGDFAEEEEED